MDTQYVDICDMIGLIRYNDNISLGCDFQRISENRNDCY